jgi:hypothetical protein
VIAPGRVHRIQGLPVLPADQPSCFFDLVFPLEADEAGVALSYPCAERPCQGYADIDGRPIDDDFQGNPARPAILPNKQHALVATDDFDNSGPAASAIRNSVNDNFHDMMPALEGTCLPAVLSRRRSS